MKRINKGTWILFAVLFSAFVIMVVIAALIFRPWEMAFVHYGQNAEPFTDDKYVAVKVIEDGLTPWEKLNPLHRWTRAEELLADKPAGTEVYEFETPEGTERIWRTPEGDLYIEKDSEITEITAYRKPLPPLGFELRPVVGGYVGNGVGGIAGVDLIRVYAVHSGPRVAYDATGHAWSGGIGAGYNVWRNIDAGLYAGYGEGMEFGGTLTIAIQ